MIREQNQVLSCPENIMEITATTAKKPAFIKIAVPDKLAEALLKQYASKSEGTISQLELVWKDDTISNQK